MTTVNDIFSTDETYAIALESALGPVLNYLVVDTMEEALAAATLLKEKKKDWLPLSHYNSLALPMILLMVVYFTM